MAAGNRSGEDRLASLEKLAASPEKHHIFHAFRMLEAAFPDAPRIGKARRPREDAVRHGQEAELKFPPSTLAAFEPPKGQKPGRLTNRFFGMFGPSGPLPLHLTEYARERMRNHRDPTLVRFADMLTHRLTTLFYRAWRSGQPAPSFDRGENDGIEQKVAAIAGFHGQHLRGKDHLPDLAKRHFAGLLSQGPKNAEGLQSMIQAFFGARVEVQEFVGCWLELEPDDRWQMGAPAQLGRTASIGDRVWTRSAKFRLRIGPLSYADYQRLLPGGGSLARLRAVVRNYVGDALDWDVNLVLAADDIPQPKLGETVRLGQTGWIGQKTITKDADDLFLEPNAQTHAAVLSGGT
ncbi:type VI secretion system baseplate subunit TssG [uncultured Tateyamaria sp.]|uniref:type VI secretion system baseplate subunit TssG n=1 Tax=uncultured Tateyamaria sp. TaxID=455651 RepID=UPI0026388201|nr:type VI secretion system baseplate subunit TssG [uncultured Tateyamaria sp.]